MNSDDKIRSLKDKANRLPLEPGVYIMKNKNGDIIYVGKAKALKNRVTQYFGSHTNHSAKVIKMVENVNDFETIICTSEYEALMLENSLIKQHQPKYNILLKDDKGYHYIKVTSERWPRIETAKSISNDNAEYIGPYYSNYVVQNAVDETLKIFKLPVCHRSFDKKTKPCLNYHIGICSAPCNGMQTHEEYIHTVNEARAYIKCGGVDESEIAKLNEKMLIAAEKLQFETAARLRDRINALTKSKEKQKVILSEHMRQDIFSIATVGENACVGFFCFKNGHLVDKEVFFLDGRISKEEYYSEFLSQFYQLNRDIPPEIAVDCEFEEIPLITEWLSGVKGAKVSIRIPQKGRQKELVDMCLSNAAHALSDKIMRTVKETYALNELAELLGLKSVPRKIEAYDISNTAGNENVGAMVVYIDGRAAKSLYRKFRIKSFSGQDDYRSLNEILDRRFNEYVLGNDESFSTLPDLILLDGGKGQVSAVTPLLEKYGLNVPIFGMVKDGNHRTRAISSGGADVQIKSNRKVFTFITELQDEVHRTAIGYHHQRSKISSLQLELTKIPNVGEATAKKLITTFKTLSKIKSLTVDEFKSNGFSSRVAESVVRYFEE